MNKEQGSTNIQKSLADLQAQFEELVSKYSEWLSLYGYSPELIPPDTPQANKHSDNPEYQKVLEEAEQTRTGDYHVYVILLDDAIRKIRNSGSSNSFPPCVYVGQSWYTPEERFDQHLSGKKFSRHVRKFGMRLMPELYERYNPLASRKQAEEVERALAQKLREDDYVVYGGH